MESLASSWRNEMHRAQWKMTLIVYSEPLRSKSVAEIVTEDVLKVLQPLWTTRPETASRLRGRIERVFDFARARGQRAGENPARWRGHLDAILPKRAKLTRGHHKAMPFDEVPAFMAALREREGVAPRALEFAILTAARSGEVLGARWNEFDLGARVWIVPAARMKAGREHRVPLSARAVEILRQVEQKRLSEFVLPGMRSGRPLSVMALEMVLRRMKVNSMTLSSESGMMLDPASYAIKQPDPCPMNGRTPFPSASSDDNALRLTTTSLNAFVRLDLPKCEHVLSPILPVRSLAMLLPVEASARPASAWGCPMPLRPVVISSAGRLTRPGGCCTWTARCRPS